MGLVTEDGDNDQLVTAMSWVLKGRETFEYLAEFIFPLGLFLTMFNSLT